MWQLTFLQLHVGTVYKFNHFLNKNKYLKFLWNFHISSAWNENGYFCFLKYVWIRISLPYPQVQIWHTQRPAILNYCGLYCWKVFCVHLYPLNLFPWSLLLLGAAVSLGNVMTWFLAAVHVRALTSKVWRRPKFLWHSTIKRRCVNLCYCCQWTSAEFIFCRHWKRPKSATHFYTTKSNENIQHQCSSSPQYRSIWFR